MARLPRMAPRMEAMRPTLAAPKDEAGRTAYRRQVNPWRDWYGLARWKAVPNGLRWRVLERDLFQCQMCMMVEAPRDLVCDHKTAHRGDPALFWSEANLWCICSHCHNSVKQREERREGFT